MDAMWNNNTTLTFIPERNDAARSGPVGKPVVWSPMQPPYPITHGIGHPHVCDWSAGLEMMANKIKWRERDDICEGLASEDEDDDESGHTEKDNKSNDTSFLRSAALDGTHAAHVVEVLELCERSSTRGGTLESTVSCFRPLLPFVSPLQHHIQQNIVFGTMKLKQADNPLHLLDAVWGMGCRTFDVGHIYGKEVEGLMGKWWSKHRAGQSIAREEMVLIGKGGHPFHNSSHLARLEKSALEKDLHESLQRLCTDYLDVYLLHRDDPLRYPNVTDIVRTMHQLILSGKIKQWGTSNFTPARIGQLHSCAKEHGWIGPTYSSPQYSLARPTRSVWNGTTRWTSEHRDVFEQHAVPRRTKCLVWATLGEGCLVGNVTERQGGQECWLTSENQQRKDRLERMAAAKGVSAAVVAIAYVLNYIGRDTTSAIVGCRTVAHFQDAVRAAAMKLSPEELKYLRCEE